MFSPGIVVYDPHCNVDGDVEFSNPTVDRRLQNGCAVLPYDADRHGEPLAGYRRRGWGPEGWVVDDVRGDRACPMDLWLLPERPWIYWTAVIQGTRPNPQGTIRLIADGALSGIGGGLVGVGDDLVTTALEYDQIAIVRGRRRVSATVPALLHVHLHVQAVGVALLVTAVSQSRVDVAFT